jgi:hypothetical protein
VRTRGFDNAVVVIDGMTLRRVNALGITSRGMSRFGIKPVG